MILPQSIKLANLPTPIFPFNPLNESYDGTNLYIKRDDYTGSELSGNKLRKIEFALAEALNEKATVLITCGGIQSNHCRATAGVAAQFGLKSHLVLRGQEDRPDGNYFLDMMLGANFTFVTPEQYKNERTDIMNKLKADYDAKGMKAYILPEGASNGIGSFGYYKAFEEILEQEKQLGVTFDTICATEGSGGTVSGLYAANEIYGAGKNIVMVNIYDGLADVKAEVIGICEEARVIGKHAEPINYDNIHAIMDYAGEGYGLASPELVDFIKKVARNTGIIFDPVYTGKTLFGLINEIKKGNELFKGNVLFIHTGGLFGVFGKKDLFL